jgi:hypothetical protein
MPARSIRSIVSRESDAGPIVQTIFVLWGGRGNIVVLITSSLRYGQGPGDEGLTLQLHGKGGTKRLKALLKATIRIVSFVLQEPALCVIDPWFEPLSSPTVSVSPQQGFRRIRPAFSGRVLQGSG